MANVRQRDLPGDPKAREIVKLLAELCYSRRQDDVFDAWLEACNCLIDMLPAHARSSATAGKPAEDTPEVAQRWARLKSRFGSEWPKAQDIFARAWIMLQDAGFDEGKPTYQDLLGEIYMAWGWPNAHTGQFFTPWPIARMMAEMTVTDNELYDRLTASYLKTRFGKLHQLMGRTEEQIREFVKGLGAGVLNVIEEFDPITICDPCCGSGVMLLAAASVLPDWAVQSGLVQTYGMDIDMTCVQMARMNVAIYGLNGFGVKCYLAMSEGELERVPLAESQRQLIDSARTADSLGDAESVAELALEYRQLSLAPMF